MARGRFLRLFIGNMASGKTRHLLTEIDTLRKYGNKKIAVFKPLTDTRSGLSRIKSRKGDEDSAEEIPVNNPKEMWMLLRAKESAAGSRFEVVAFDEVQFFPRDSGFFQGSIKNPACWADERMALAIFLIAWLLADQEQSG